MLALLALIVAIGCIAAHRWPPRGPYQVTFVAPMIVVRLDTRTGEMRAYHLNETVMTEIARVRTENLSVSAEARGRHP